MKRLDITKITIDEEYLITSLKTEVMSNEIPINFVVMNTSTLDILKQTKIIETNEIPIDMKWFSILNIPIAICDRMDFGEIEIV
jgi:hypothetical protein